MKRILFAVFLLSPMASAQSLPPAIPAGTPIKARLESVVNTSTSEVGDSVVAVMTQQLQSERTVVVPRGSRLHGRVETVQHATRADEGRVRLVFRELELADGQRLQTWITNSFIAKRPRRDARYVVSMGAGAIAGGLIGGKRGRVAGIIGGLLTGFIIAGSDGTPSVRDLMLNIGQQIRLELGQDLVFPGKSTSQ